MRGLVFSHSRYDPGGTPTAGYTFLCRFHHPLQLLQVNRLCTTVGQSSAKRRAQYNRLVEL